MPSGEYAGFENELVRAVGQLEGMVSTYREATDRLTSTMNRLGEDVRKSTQAVEKLTHKVSHIESRVESLEAQGERTQRIEVSFWDQTVGDIISSIMMKAVILIGTAAVIAFIVWFLNKFVGTGPSL